MSSDGYLTIGKLVEKLQDKYPDLSVSKVRYLQDQGLINPLRSEGGYRLYSNKDLERLDTILQLQKTRFLPLAVIKDELERMEATGQAEALEQSVSVVDSPEVVNRLHPIDRMPELLSVSVSFVRALEEVGLIEFKKSPQGRDLVDGHDFALIRCCSELRSYGFEPKNLRSYVIAANRESASFEQALVSYSAKAGGVEVQDTHENRARFDAAFSHMLKLTNDLRSTLIKKRVKRRFSGDEKDI